MVVPPDTEIATAGAVLRLARHEFPSVLLVMVLGLASAVFEGVGLSFLIPLVKVATGAGMDYSIPLIGPLVAHIEAYVPLGGIQLVMLIVGFFMLGIAVSYLNVVVSNVLAMRFAHQLRVRIFDMALNRPLSSLESMPAGKFVNNLASNTWQVCDALFLLISVIVELITFAVFMAFLLLLSPFYTAILVGMTLLMAIIVQFATQKVRGYGAGAVAANEAFMSYVWDALGGLRVIRGFGREAHERARFAASSNEVRENFVRLRVLSGIVGPITQIMTVAMVAVILGIAILRGDPVATLAGFLAIAYRMQPRVSAILQVRTSLRGLAAPVAEIEAALSDPGALAPSPAVRSFAGLKRGIVMEGVWARYPNSERPALTDISCAFPYGEVTAIAGHSGAGKSTMVALLLRFVEPERGKVLVDGTPLSEIEPEDWHRRIAFVEQNAFLFNATVRDNIGYGDLAADLDAIKEAARIAQAEDFILGLAQGYDTLIGDNGVQLSAGQRQRIALARSLLRKPDILILDEATNALDRPTERALRMSIEAGRSARAIIVIAHRRETIKNADQVIVVDRGRVVQAGSPAELARVPGVYRRLYLDEPVSEG